MPMKMQSFVDEHEVVAFMNAHSLTSLDVSGPLINNSGRYVVFYLDETVAPVSIDPNLGLSGVSVGVGAVVAAGGTLLEVQALRTQVTNEVLMAGTAIVIDTFAGAGYVIPGTVQINDSNSVAPILRDDGMGRLVTLTDGSSRGSINYSAHTVAIHYRANEVPTGNVRATYQHSLIPDSTAIPDACALSGIVIEKVSGSIAACAWEIFEEEAMAYAPIAVGESSGTLTRRDELGHLVSICLEKDLAKRGRRWVKVSPDANGVVMVRLYWSRPSKN